MMIQLTIQMTLTFACHAMRLAKLALIQLQQDVYHEMQIKYLIAHTIHAHVTQDQQISILDYTELV